MAAWAVCAGWRPCGSWPGRSLDALTDGELPSLLFRPSVIRLLDLTYGQVLHSQLKERLLIFLRSHAARLEEQMKNQVRANLDRLK